MIILITLLNCLYSVVKLIIPQKNTVVLLSRQSNKPSIDFSLIIDYLNKNSIENSCLCAVLKLNPLSLLAYLVVINKQLILLAKAKVVIVDGYVIPVCILKHRDNLRVIQIWHASGTIKEFGYQTLDKADGSSAKIAVSMKMHHNYDYILSPSKLSVEFLAKAYNSEHNKFFISGLPRLDYLKKQQRVTNKQIDSRKPLALYAPTFRKGQSLKLAQELIENFDYDLYNLVVKLHPVDQTALESDKAIIDNEYDSLTWLTVCDKFISDYSGLICDASFIKKDIYLYTPDYDEYIKSCGLNIDLKKELSNHIYDNSKDLLKGLEKKYDNKEIITFAKKYMPPYSNNQTEKIGELIKSLL